MPASVIVALVARRSSGHGKRRMSPRSSSRRATCERRGRVAFVRDASSVMRMVRSGTLGERHEGDVLEVGEAGVAQELRVEGARQQFGERDEPHPGGGFLGVQPSRVAAHDSSLAHWLTQQLIAARVLVVPTSNRVEWRGEDHHMTTVSIIGSGNMGTAIGGIVAAGGNTVEYVGRDTSDAITGDIVVLAVPHPSLDEIVATRGASSPARSSSTSRTR